jgi:hypothetical protein
LKLSAVGPDNVLAGLASVLPEGGFGCFTKIINDSTDGIRILE